MNMYKLKLAIFKLRKALVPLGKLWNNGRMDSQPFFLWIALFIMSQWHRHTIIPIENVIAEASLVWVWPIVLSLGILIFAGKNPKIIGASVAGIVVSGWMLAATVFGPTLPIFMTGFMMTIGLGLPFWMARANYRVSVKKAENPSIVGGVSIKPPKGEFDDVSYLRGAEWMTPDMPTLTGGLRRLKLPEGMGARTFCQTKLEGMGNFLKIGPDDVELLEVPGMGHLVDVYTHRVDILAEPTEWPNLRATSLSILEPVPVGLNRDGSIKYIDLVEKHLLVGGEPGSGKSNVITMIVGTGILDPNCIVIGMDGKRTELYPWRNMMAAYVQDDIDDALSLLRLVQDQMSRDQDMMNELEIRKFSDSGGLIKPKLLVIDELARYLRTEDKNKKQEFIRRLSDILDRGRSAGLMVVAVTQVPSKNLMSGDMKRGFTHRMALRMSDTDGSEFVLEARIPDASKLPNDNSTKGYGYIREGGQPRKFRAFWVPDISIKDMAARGFEPETMWELETSGQLEITAGAIFPDGAEIPMNRQNLWDSLSSEPMSNKELADLAGMTPQAIKPILDEWVSRGYLTKGRRGNATTYYR
jgi:S-DNA-T family DNA segregation ATPase FtsK/SpoIIIE